MNGPIQPKTGPGVKPWVRRLVEPREARFPGAVA